MNQLDMNGRVAVVTGGAQGIGRAVCERIAASGGVVHIWDRDGDLAAAASKEITGSTPHRVDVTDPASVQAGGDAVMAASGQIDILVNNAGIAGPTAKTWDCDLESWEQTMSINLTGPFLCCRAVVPHMRTAGYGRIVNVASIAGKEGNPNAAPYSASKAGVIALTKSLGKELADLDIAVNCVTPAAAKTRIFDQITQEHIDYMLSKIPRGRFLKVEEAASMIAWLASQDNSFTTGAVFDLSGGRATY